MVWHGGRSDGQTVEVTADVALNVFTSYLATAARVDIDWPLVRHTDSKEAMTRSWPERLNEFTPKTSSPRSFA